MPNVHLTSPTGNKTVDLWQAEEDRDVRDGNLDVTPFVTFDSDETFLTGMTEQHTATITGRATGNRLAADGGYSSDPVTALAEWVQDVMALVNGEQGAGLTLTHDIRGFTRTVIAESFGWQRDAGAKFEVAWDLTLKMGEGVMPTADTAPNAANPSTAWSLAGYDLYHPKQYREEKRERTDLAEMLFADTPEENLIMSESGPMRTVTIVGTHEGTTSQRNAWDDAIRDLIGQDQTHTYSSAFPGHDLQVMVNRFEGTREAGVTRLGDYVLELIEGTTSV